MFRIDQASKKSKATSTCDSSNVWNETKPCSISCVGSHSAVFSARASAQRWRNCSIASTLCFASSLATLMISSSKNCGIKPRSSGRRTEGTVGGGGGGAAAGTLLLMVEEIEA